MKKKLIAMLPILLFAFGVLLFVNLFAGEEETFKGVRPITKHNSYYVYDLVQQKSLPCAEAIEILGVSRGYEYYFNCLKSEHIYLVRDNVVIGIDEALERNLISFEDLYNYGIADRWEVDYE